MELERAQKIVSAIVGFGLSTILGEPKNVPFNLEQLREISLLDMLEAVADVELADKMRAKNNPNGTQHFHVIPDDRLTAAVYAFLHYSYGDFEDEDEVIVTRRDANGVHFMIVGARDPAMVREEEEETV